MIEPISDYGCDGSERCACQACSVQRTEERFAQRDAIHDGIVATLRSLRFRSERRGDRVWIEAARADDVLLVTRVSSVEWMVRLIDKVHKRELARRTVEVRRDCLDDPAWIGSMVAYTVNRMQREFYQPDDGQPRRRRRR